MDDAFPIARLLLARDAIPISVLFHIPPYEQRGGTATKECTGGSIVGLIVGQSSTYWKCKKTLW
jgi:hypothetical protein